MDSLTDHSNKIANNFLYGKLLVSTPTVFGGIFEKAVVFISSYDSVGALGIIINKELKSASAKETLSSMGIKLPRGFKNMPLHLGGPVDTNRGFVLHSNDYKIKSTIQFDSNVCITGEKKILQDYVEGNGPKKIILALGHCGWGLGQIESEIKDNVWLCVDSSEKIIFGTENDAKWQQAGTENGIDINKIYPWVGSA